MPRIETPPSETITFHVPVALLQEAQELAESEGYTQAAFHRKCWDDGLAAQAEKSNKRLVNKGLRQKYKEKPSELPESKLSIGKLKEAIALAESRGGESIYIDNTFIDFCKE